MFYGANDGMLHAVNGNPTGDRRRELWRFVPSEMFGRFNRLRDQLAGGPLADHAGASTATPRDYFVDGPITIYHKLERRTSQQVMIFVSMRRGGRLLYAFDVTPSSPQFAVAEANADSALGQTWSEPRLARMRAIQSRAAPRRRLRRGGGGCEPAGATRWAMRVRARRDDGTLLNRCHHSQRPAGVR